MNKLLERSVWMRSPIIFGLIKVTFDSVAFARKRSSLRTQLQIAQLKSQSFESENLHLIPTNSLGQSIQGSYSPIDKRFLFLHFVSDILMSNQINTSKEATPKLPKCTSNTRTLVIISVRLTCVNCLRRSMERNTTSQCFSMLFFVQITDQMQQKFNALACRSIFYCRMQWSPTEKSFTTSQHLCLWTWTELIKAIKGTPVL